MQLINTIYSVKCSQVTTMKTGNVHKQRDTIISTIVIMSVVNLQSSVHRESSKNDSNMLACCMFSLSHRAAQTGPANTRRRRFKGQIHSRERGGEGKKRLEKKLHWMTKRKGVIKYAHRCVSQRESRGGTCSFSHRQPLVVQKKQPLVIRNTGRSHARQ